MIKEINSENWRSMAKILENIEYLEGLGVTSEIKEKIIARIHSKLLWVEQVYTFGFFHNDELLGFWQFLKWPYNSENYSILHGFTKKKEEIKTLVPSESRRSILVDLLNHGIKFMEDDGRKTGWINCPKNKEHSIRWNVINKSILAQKNLTLVEEINPGETPSDPYWVWHPEHKQIRQIIKISS